MSDFPLVSMIICAFNQQDTIGEAIKSAFNQTYNNLEIIISDDCSSDDTYEIIKRYAGSYDGPHSIITNRNSVNLGIARHWDSISRTASGSLIVHAAGDDVSLPTRVDVLVRVWHTMEPRPILISSNGFIIDRSGQELGQLINIEETGEIQVQRQVINEDFDILAIYVIGFSLAVDRRLYEKLPPLTAWMWSEDEIIRSRAMLLGPMVFIPMKLVKYRDGGISKGVPGCIENLYIKRYKEHAISRINYLNQIAIDYASINGYSERFFSLTIKKLILAHRQIDLLDKGNFIGGLLTILTGVFAPVNQKTTKKDYLCMYGVKFFPKIYFYLKKLSSEGSFFPFKS